MKVIAEGQAGPASLLPAAVKGLLFFWLPQNGELLRRQPLSIRPASPSPLPESGLEVPPTPNTCVLGQAAGQRHAWIPALLLRDGPFLFSKALSESREQKADLLKSAGRAGGWEGEGGQPSARRVADFPTASVLPLGLPPGGGDGLTQVPGQLLIPAGFL